MKQNLLPWTWVPTLYFAEGIPYFVVNTISVTMFTKMGVPNGEMALFTSLLSLPWVVKPLWSPFVDILRTKRWWILAMQALMTICLILLAISLPSPSAETIASGQTSIGLFKFTLILFFITAFASATHDIAADGFYMLALTSHDQSFFVGIRSTFYRLSSIFGQGVLVYLAGHLELSTGNIPRSWALTIGIAAIIFCLVTIYHCFAIPRPREDVGTIEGRRVTAREVASEFGRTFVSFFRKKGVVLAIVFMLLYRLPEALLLKMVNPFLLGKVSDGGLALSTQDVGLVYGTIGVLALTIGGILGGMAASRWGLKRCLWPMALSLALPCLAFVYLSAAQPHNIWVISTCVAFDQFGYGVGFTAYMLYLMYFSEGEFKTAHYAICTAFMAMSMMIPGMFAGYIQEAVGYRGFFWMVIFCCAATLIVTALAAIKVDPEYGCKK